MTIEFDPAKNRKNLEKHGISLEEVEAFDWEAANVYPASFDRYGEVRHVGYGLLRGRLYVVVFTFRSENMKIISLRKANRRERKKYEA